MALWDQNVSGAFEKLASAHKTILIKEKLYSTELTAYERFGNESLNENLFRKTKQTLPTKLVILRMPPSWGL